MRLGGADGPLRFVRSDIEQWLENARGEWLPGEPLSRTVTRAAREVRRASPQLSLDELAGSSDP
jgi:hypothetical protein